jgi:hypothetical protein
VSQPFWRMQTARITGAKRALVDDYISHGHIFPDGVQIESQHRLFVQVPRRLLSEISAPGVGQWRRSAAQVTMSFARSTRFMSPSPPVPQAPSDHDPPHRLRPDAGHRVAMTRCRDDSHRGSLFPRGRQSNRAWQSNLRERNAAPHRVLYYRVPGFKPANALSKLRARSDRESGP